MRLTMESIATASLWHNTNHKKCDLFLADIPMEIHKNRIMNSMHLVELEETFKDVAYHSSTHDSIFNSALMTAPDLLLHHSDEHIAAVINLISKDRKNIFVVCGKG